MRGGWANPDPLHGGYMVVKNQIEKNKALNKTDKKAGKKKFIKWLFILFIFLLELFVYTGARVACTGIEYRITEAKKMQKKLKAYRAELMLEKARLSSPGRIFKIAGTKLGLVMPSHDRIVYINGGKNK